MNFISMERLKSTLASHPFRRKEQDQGMGVRTPDASPISLHPWHYPQRKRAVKRQTNIRASFLRYWMLVFLLSPLQGLSQSGEWELLRHQWTSRDGLPDWNIHCFMQDSKGLMWLLSNTGLFTFDGQSFHPIPSFNNRKDPWRITKLAEDIHGNIWLVGSADNTLRIDILHPETEQIQPIEEYLHLSQPFRLKVKANTLFLYNVNREIWIGSHQAGYHYDGHWKKVYSRKQDAIDTWFPAPEGKFWLRNQERIYLSNSTGMPLDSFPRPGSVLRWLWQDSDYTLWTAYSLPGEAAIAYYYQLLPNRQRISGLYTPSIPQTPWINEQVLDAQGKQFAGHGLLLTRFTDGLFLGKAHSPRLFNLSVLHPDAENMLAFYFDQEGAIWSCTTEGLVRFVLRRKAPFQTRLSNLTPVHSMRGLVRSGSYLYALGYGGAKKIDLRSGQSSPISFPSNYMGYAIYKQGDTIWIGTDQHGISALLPNGAKKTYPVDAGLLTFAFVHSPSHGLLAGTSRGIYRLNPRTNTFERASRDRFEVYTFHENKAGLWAGTSDGVLLFDSNLKISLQALEPGKKTNYQRPLFLCEDGPDQFWIATRGGGLLHWNYKNGQLDQFNTDNGLSSNNIHAVYPDAFGFLWLPSDHGLMRFREKDHLVQTFQKSDGIADDEFNFLSHFQDTDGTLYFGGINGITYFHPRDVRLAAEFTRPLQLIEAKSFQLKSGVFSVQAQNAKATAPLRLNPSDAFLDLSFSPLLYQGNSPVRFAWKIAGFQEKWVQQNEPLIRISHLPYGNQHLQVRFSRMDNQWSKIHTFPIVVPRPFYLRLPFFLLVLSLLIAIIYGFALWRNRRLQTTNVQLEREVQKRTAQINENLAIIEQDKQTILYQSQELRALDEMKSRFFTNITHELRTPLTLILGPLDRLLQNRASVESKSELLGTVQRNALKLLNLVDELLDLSKLEANKLVLEVKPLHLKSFLQRISDSFLPFAQHRGIDLQFHYFGTSQLTVLTDSKKLEKIINNLIGNALKFTPSLGKIVVVLRFQQNTLSVEVRDNGKGIAPEDLPFIFDRYYQSKDPNGSLQGGAGIGLALAREYARLFGGTLEVQSTPGNGSTFILQIACQETAPINQPEAIPAASFATTTTGTTDKQAAPNQSSKPTLLLVEDDEDLQQYIQSILWENYQVLTAANGKEALVQMEHQAVDLILSDIMMPEMDGFQLLHTVKENQPDIPFIFLTARIETPDRLQALRLGVDDYLTKPFQEEELLARLHNLIERYHIRRAIRLAPDSPFEENPSTKSEASETYDEKWLRQLESLVLQHLHQPEFSVQRMAEAMHITERTLQYKTKAHTGLSPNQYLVEARLQKARQLLESRSFQTIAEVCYACGFKTTQYFARLMKERFGKSPSDW